MAYYQQPVYPSVPQHSPYLPPASPYANTYLTPQHAQSNIYATPQHAQTAMPAYYSSPAYSHSPSHRHRSHSVSHTRSHQPQVVYSTSSGHHGGTTYPYPASSGGHGNDLSYDSGGHRRHHSTAGTTHYPASSSHRSQSHRRTPSYHVSSATQPRRSHSTSRHRGQVIEVRPQHHNQPVYIDSARRHRRSSEPSVGERIRRLFGFGARPEYTDARTGRQVDYRGRPIYKY